MIIRYLDPLGKYAWEHTHGESISGSLRKDFSVLRELDEEYSARVTGQVESQFEDRHYTI